MYPLKEVVWQRRLTDYCDYLKLLWYHNPDSRRSTGGFPDLVIVGPGGVLFIELKTDVGRMSLVQREWQSALHEAGAEAHVWRPTDWPNVEMRLRHLAKPYHKANESPR